MIEIAEWHMACDPMRSRYMEVEVALMLFRSKLNPPTRLESFLRSVKNSFSLSMKLYKMKVYRAALDGKAPIFFFGFLSIKTSHLPRNLIN
jgi:hypothetical protein